MARPSRLPAALGSSAVPLEAVVDAIPLACWALDRDLRVIACNARLVELLGGRPEPGLALEILGDAHATTLRCAAHLGIEGVELATTAVVPGPDGTSRLCTWRHAPLFESGALAGWLGTASLHPTAGRARSNAVLGAPEPPALAGVPAPAPWLTELVHSLLTVDPRSLRPLGPALARAATAFGADAAVFLRVDSVRVTIDERWSAPSLPAGSTLLDELAAASVANASTIESPLLLSISKPGDREIRAELDRGAMVLVPATPTSGSRAILALGWACGRAPDLDALEATPVVASLFAFASARMDAERAARLAERRFATLIDLLHDHAVYTLDAEGRVASWTATATRIEGLEEVAALGRAFEDFWTPDDRARGAPARLLESAEETGFASTEAWRLRGTGAERFLARVSVAVMRDPAGRRVGYIAATRDLTSRLELELRLHHAQKMEALGRLAGGIAHDFNNLLMVIRGAAELLAGEVSPTARETVAEIEDAARRGADLSRQMMAIVRRTPVRASIADLNGIVHGIGRMLKRAVGDGVVVTLTLAEGLGGVCVDPGQMEHVILNLALNARDAMAGRGRLHVATYESPPPAEARSRPAATDAATYVVLEMTDDGCGMDDATRARIFEPFFTTKHAEHGTGLGLTTVQAIVREAGGLVVVESALGRGTTFRVYLPRAEPARSTSQHVAGVAGDARARPGETVLVVEDDPHVRAVIERTLRARAYDVLVAEDPDDAEVIACHHELRLDALVADVQLPGRSGHELAARLRTIRPELSVVLISGAESEWPSAAYADGRTRKLTKPFTGAELGAALRRLLDGGASDRR